MQKMLKDMHFIWLTHSNENNILASNTHLNTFVRRTRTLNFIYHHFSTYEKDLSVASMNRRKGSSKKNLFLSSPDWFYKIDIILFFNLQHNNLYHAISITHLNSFEALNFVGL